jgi:hypothetical protein
MNTKCEVSKVQPKNSSADMFCDRFEVYYKRMGGNLKIKQFICEKKFTLIVISTARRTFDACVGGGIYVRGSWL